MGDDGKEIEVPVLKLADFGLGNRFGLQRLRTICGSMLYYSPEIISNQKYYGPEVDCWCLGIALFRMTAGFEPFAHAHSKFLPPTHLVSLTHLCVLLLTKKKIKLSGS